MQLASQPLTIKPMLEHLCLQSYDPDDA
eukprot:SAG31_NODE_16443_length_709_cov_0.983607_1_plen_27_part_10